MYMQLNNMCLLQSSGDSFRLLKYDLSHATHGLSPAPSPLLTHRHNAAPGMFLVGIHMHTLFECNKNVPR